jgi:short-subunit dehydrogenase
MVPRMVKRGGGYLLNTASAAGLLSQIGSATYAVTKHAAVALAEWIAITHGHEGIKVSVLCPQAVRTRMTAGNEGGVASVDGMIEPDEVAETVVKALDEERFLVLPHPQVAEYMRRKATDYDRWLRGMRRLAENYR